MIGERYVNSRRKMLCKQMRQIDRAFSVRGDVRFKVTFPGFLECEPVVTGAESPPDGCLLRSAAKDHASPRARVNNTSGVFRLGSSRTYCNNARSVWPSRFPVMPIA